MRALGQGSPSRKAGAEGISLFLCIGSYLDYPGRILQAFLKKKNKKKGEVRYITIPVYSGLKKKKSKIEKPPILRTFFKFVQIAVVVSPLTLRYGVKKN